MKRNQVENKKQLSGRIHRRRNIVVGPAARYDLSVANDRFTGGNDEETTETPGTNSRHVHHDRIVETGLIKISFQWPDFATRHVPDRCLSPDEKRRTINWLENKYTIFRDRDIVPTDTRPMNP